MYYVVILSLTKNTSLDSVPLQKVRDKQLPILSYSLPIPRKSGIQIQLRQEHVREQGIVCVCVGERERERERERNGESKDAISVSLFWISGSLPRDRIATVHCSSLGIGLRDQTLQTVHVDVCSS